MYIIAGLGNPGKRYENTRHNIGFIAIDYLAREYSIKVSKIKHKALVGEGIISGHKVLLVKPQTYMNLSGNSIREIMDYYKVEPKNLIVIYDDIDLAVGRIRIREKGSAGTHNGMRSIIYHLESEQFPRVRIGIGRSEHIDLADFVTSGFVKHEIPVMEDAVIRASKAACCIFEEGIGKAMSQYNIKLKQAGEEQEHE